VFLSKHFKYVQNFHNFWLVLFDHEKNENCVLMFEIVEAWSKPEVNNKIYIHFIGQSRSDAGFGPSVCRWGFVVSHRAS
jgi:hypothetical protein